jgi:hypothetical protein
MTRAAQIHQQAGSVRLSSARASRTTRCEAAGGLLMTEDRRKRDTTRARFTRRSTDHALDFGDLPTVPMDLYPEAPRIPTGEVVKVVEVDSWQEYVDALEAVNARRSSTLRRDA